MDKKKKIMTARHLMIMAILALAFPLCAQEVSEIGFFGHDEPAGTDSITLKLGFCDADKNKYTPPISIINDKLIIKEDGSVIPTDRITVNRVTTGKRIPNDYTFSVLVDLSISASDKEVIFDAIENLVKQAPDSCVYLSWFGDEVSQSRLLTIDNINQYKNTFIKKEAFSKHLFSALYAKLVEFKWANDSLEQYVCKEDGYETNKAIAVRAQNARNKNYLFIFTDNHRPEPEPYISLLQVTDYQTNSDTTIIRPKVYAFYYAKDGMLNESVQNVFEGITTHPEIPAQFRGTYKSYDNIENILKDFEEVVNDASYDYEVTYQRTPGKPYNGDVFYEAYWGEGNKKGQAKYSIGYIEQVTGPKDSPKWIYYLWALLITVLAIAFFFFVMKILIPGVKSKVFAAKYFKRYVPEENVQRRTCYYCRQEILPGDRIVTRCRHIMHVSCWKQNDFQCAEYGQNCKEGIQEHIEWGNLLSANSLRDLYLTTMGIVAGLVSWIVYTLIGGNLFKGLATGIANTFLNVDEIRKEEIFNLCVDKISSLLIIGLLLGFFISLVMRHNDGVRRNDFKSIMKTIGLSLLTAVIGMAAFALGSIIFCWIVSSPNVSPNDWFCSLPAYLLFAICTSLSLCIKSSIPLKSAFLGGLCSAVIGFLVLYFSNFASPGLNTLLNFIIFGGGLGASLVTVRMLAEKYFLVIKNGVKAGQRIPIHKWMNATGGGNKVTIGMIESCEIQMSWEKSNKVAKEHVQLYVDHQRSQAMMRPLATGMVFNSRTELPVGKPVPLANNDTFTVGDTIFQYVEN